MSVATDIAFAREPIAGLWPEMAPLMAAHHAEIFPYQDVQLDVDTAGYDFVDNAGMMRCFTARADGKLVGYSVFFVRRAMTAALLLAHQDGHYLAPEFRIGCNGLQMLRFAERALIADGAQLIVQGCKVDHDLGPLFRRLGYQPMDLMFYKRVG